MATWQSFNLYRKFRPPFWIYIVSIQHGDVNNSEGSLGTALFNEYPGFSPRWATNKLAEGNKRKSADLSRYISR